MTVEHGLIKVGALQQETIPDGARLFVNVDGIMYGVKRTRRYSRVGYRLTVATSEGNKTVAVNPDDFLVISYNNLEGADVESVYAHSRIASLPLRTIDRQSYKHDESCSGLVG